MGSAWQGQNCIVEICGAITRVEGRSYYKNELAACVKKESERTIETGKSGQICIFKIPR